MAQRAGILVPRLEGENPVGMITKGYAQLENTTGVPPGDLQSVLGTATTVGLVNETGLTDSAWEVLSPGNVALLLPHAVFGQGLVRTADTMKVVLKRGARDSTERQTWTYEFPADRWLALTAAAAGDELVYGTGIHITNSSPETGAAISIRVGRTANNEVLIQKGIFGIPVNPGGWVVDVTVEFDVYTGGILGSRIYELRAFNQAHRISVVRRSATRPSVPSGDDVEYDGARVSTLTSSGWVTHIGGPADFPSGTDPLWFAATNAKYDFIHKVWTIDNDNWTLASAAEPFAIMFSTSEEGPWHSPVENADTLARIRDGAGNLLVFPINDTEYQRNVDRNWRLLARYSLPLTGTRRHTTLERFDPRRFRFFEFSVTWTGSLETYSVIVPARFIKVHAASSSLTWPSSNVSGQNLVVSFPNHAAPFANLDDNRNIYHPQFAIPMRFEHDGTDTASVYTILFGTWPDSSSVTLEIRGF